MTQYMTPGLAATLAHAVKPFLEWHTYTKTIQTPTSDDPITTGVDESTNAWGEQVVTYPTISISGLPCMYQETGSIYIGPNGPVEVNQPILLVPPSDTLEDGDLVSNILAMDKVTVLLEGPVPVESTTKIALVANGALYTQANLRQTVEVLQ